MEDEIQIEYVENPDEGAYGVIGRGLRSFNEQQAGKNNRQSLCFVLRDAQQTMVGGLIGATYWNWLYIEVFWIPEDLRGRGFGDRLIALAEEEARKRGATHAYLDTFSFQAPGFYKKHGYAVFGELQDFPPGHQRYFFTKQL
jgi:GNAT superfamily N-acetyltransferase